MLLEHFDAPWDYELLDTGVGFRLEKWGNLILQRPDPQIIWPRSLPDGEWHKAAAIFKSPKWEIKHAPPNPWIINFQDVRFLLKLSPFKHTGIFAEQAAQWEWMLNRIQNAKFKMQNNKPILRSAFKILNLFGYTGGATIILAKVGCKITHVDASKPAISWANENHKLNGLALESVRWILDDAVKFVKREIKRGAKYDGIIMDPPAFGHSPTGKTWKFNEDLPGLLNDCVKLLSDEAKFLVINGYATNSSAIAINNLMEDALRNRSGKIEFGELCLKQKSGRLISTGIFSRWSYS